MENQTLFNALDAQKTIDFITEQMGSFPGYIFFADDDLIKIFDTLWEQGFRLTCLQMLADLDDVELSCYIDVKMFIENEQ